MITATVSQPGRKHYFWWKKSRAGSDDINIECTVSFQQSILNFEIAHLPHFQLKPIQIKTPRIAR
jgi:hypothetical protein